MLLHSRFWWRKDRFLLLHDQMRDSRIDSKSIQTNDYRYSYKRDSLETESIFRTLSCRYTLKDAVFTPRKRFEIYLKNQLVYKNDSWEIGVPSEVKKHITNDMRAILELKKAITIPKSEERKEERIKQRLKKEALLQTLKSVQNEEQYQEKLKNVTDSAKRL